MSKQNRQERERVIREFINDPTRERAPDGAANEPPPSAVKHCERLSERAEWRRARASGVFRPPRPVLGFAGWRYSSGHSPLSFKAAVTSKPAAGVMANPGGFGFFL